MGTGVLKANKPVIRELIQLDEIKQNQSKLEKR